MTLLELSIALIAICVLLAILWPVWPGGHGVSRKAACLSNTKQTATGLIMYTDDHDGKHPFRDDWMDATTPYIKARDVFRCVCLKKPPQDVFGRAFNSALAGKRASNENYADTPLVYDSLNLAWNASDPFLSFPPPESGRQSIGYADGHVRKVKPGSP
jgi:hypothetical protein